MAAFNINLRVGMPYYKGTKSLDGNLYRFTISWNTTSEVWHMNIEGLSNDVDIKGIALLPGKDLLSPFGYRNVLGQLWVIDGEGRGENPDYANMGLRWTLEYTPTTG